MEYTTQSVKTRFTSSTDVGFSIIFGKTKKYKINSWYIAMLFRWFSRLSWKPTHVRHIPNLKFFQSFFFHKGTFIRVLYWGIQHFYDLSDMRIIMEFLPTLINLRVFVLALYALYFTRLTQIFWIDGMMSSKGFKSINIICTTKRYLKIPFLEISTQKKSKP